MLGPPHCQQTPVSKEAESAILAKCDQTYLHPLLLTVDGDARNCGQAARVI